jgi:hypothetical protein
MRQNSRDRVLMIFRAVSTSVSTKFNSLLVCYTSKVMLNAEQNSFVFCDIWSTQDSDMERSVLRYDGIL